MKKILLMMIMVVLSSVGFSESKKYFGGFWHIGGQISISPQPALHAELTTLGYPGFTGTGYGLTFGGGGLVNNLFIGGWGSWDFNDERVVNATTQKTLTGGTGGRGGFEIGYSVLNTEKLHLIPSLSMVWGGSSYSFSTNMSFTDYVNNPPQFSPKFGINEFSLGLGLSLLMGNKNTGLMVKAIYMYDLSQTLEPVNFTSGPALSPHSVMITAEMYMGGISDKKEFHEEDGQHDKPKGISIDVDVQ